MTGVAGSGRAPSEVPAGEASVAAAGPESWSRLLVHYDEIALKGGNRPFVEKTLAANLRRALGDLAGVEAKRMPGRIVVSFDRPIEAALVRERVERIPGIANFAPVLRVPLDVERLAETVVRRIRRLDVRTFGVRARRAVKNLSTTSDEINARVGQAVVESVGLGVDLGNPDVWVRIEALPREFLVTLERYPGVGGLPVGVAGKVAVMLSGGIDSPVAAFRVMRRGARAVLVHFHSAPFTDGASREKAVELAELLSRYQGRSLLHLCPLGEVQRRIVASAPPALRVLLYRRFMFRITERLGRESDAQAIATGECLGQVASQTLENMSAVEAVTDLAVLRPLIGFDKREIVDEAQRIGTYEVSIEPHSDCCSFLMPRRPATRSTAAALAEVERDWPVDEWVDEVVRASERLVVDPSWSRTREGVDAGEGRR